MSTARLVHCLFAAFACLIVAGCVHVPSQAENESVAQSLGYGSAPADWQPIAQAFVADILKDPESARYRFTDASAQAYWVREAPMMGNHLAVGYLVTIEVNAKNGYGGYVGFTPYHLIIRNGEVVAYKTGGEYEAWTFLARCPIAPQ